MKHRSVPAFFVLVSGLSLRFWLLAATTELQLMPGLPVSALATLCPMVAASILVHRESGPEALTHLLRRSFDFKRITEKRWYVPILLTMPAVSVLVFKQHGQERVCGGPVSRHAEFQLHAVPG